MAFKNPLRVWGILITMVATKLKLELPHWARNHLNDHCFAVKILRFFSVTFTFFWQEWKWIEKHGLHCFKLKEINAKSYLPIRNSSGPTAISVFARLQFAASLNCQRKSRSYFNSFSTKKQEKSSKFNIEIVVQQKQKTFFPLTMLNICYYTNFRVPTIWFGYFQIKKTVSFGVESNNLFRKAKINGLRHLEIMNLLIFNRIYNCSDVCLCVIHSYEHFVQVSISFYGETEEQERVKTLMSAVLLKVELI